MIDLKRIESRDNARFKQLKKLSHEARARQEAELTVLDGPHLLTAWLAAGHRCQTVWISEAALDRSEIHELADSALRQDIEVLLLPPALFAQASPVDNPSGILAVVKPLELKAAQTGSWLLLDRIQDPGNLGGLLRTAAAAGVNRVLLSAGCASAWSPKALRAGMGAQFVLPLQEQVDLLAALDGFVGRVVATGLRADSTEHFRLDLTGPVAWLFGAEGQGLSNDLFARADSIVRIPMHAGVESLNVAAAAAVCLFEQQRQRILGDD